MTLYTYVCTCKDCGTELNRAEHVPEAEQTHVAIAAPLMVGRCPNGCRSTWSDCNLRFDSEWIPEATDEGGAA